MRRSLTEDEQNKVADAIVNLQSSNWKIEQGPPLGGHGTNLMPPKFSCVPRVKHLGALPLTDQGRSDLGLLGVIPAGFRRKKIGL